MLLDPASVHQLLLPCRVDVEKLTGQGQGTKSRDNITLREKISSLHGVRCDLCKTTPSSTNDISYGEECDKLMELIRKYDEQCTSMIPVLSTLCPSCGDGVGSLISLEGRVRRMEGELRDKIATIINILRWAWNKGEQRNLEDALLMKTSPGPIVKEEGISILNESVKNDDNDLSDEEDDLHLDYTDNEDNDNANDDIIGLRTPTPDGSIKGEIVDTDGDDDNDNEGKGGSQSLDLELTDDEFENDQDLHAELEVNGITMASDPETDAKDPARMGSDVNPITDLDNPKDIDSEREERPDEVPALEQISDSEALPCEKQPARKCKITALGKIIKTDNPDSNSSSESEEEKCDYESEEADQSDSDSGSELGCDGDTEEKEGETKGRKSSNSCKAGKDPYAKFADRPKGINWKKLKELSTEGPPYLCTCMKEFNYPGSRKKHYISAHLGVDWRRRVQCLLCDREFRCGYQYSIHARSVKHRTSVMEKEGLDKLPDIKCTEFCEVCKKGFRNTVALAAHTRLAHQDDLDSNVQQEGALKKLSSKGPHLCICGKSFSCKEHYGHHYELKHTGKCHLKCDPCNQKFSTLNAYKTHMSSFEHGKRVMEGSLSERGSMNVGRIVTGSEDQSLFTCICDATFPDKHSRDVHYHIEHMGKKERECKVCGITFSLTTELMKHIKTSSHKTTMAEQKLKSKRRDTTRTEKVRGTLCDVCGKRFSTPQKLKRHTLNVHEPHKIQWKKCPHCDKSYKGQEKLRVHIIQAHKEAGRVTCLYCEEKFKTVIARQLHERSVHKGLENHKCEQCDKLFIGRHALNKHIDIIHKGRKRSYTCRKCGKTYGTSTNYYHHMNTVCGDDEEKREAAILKRRAIVAKFRAQKHYKCEECGKGYGQKAQLVSHRRREHPRDDDS